MRPRFSLKWLLTAFTILGVAFYVAFVRPTVIANRFLTFIQEPDVQGAQSLCVAGSEPFLLPGWKDVNEVTESELSPRTWNDIWKMQRRVEIRVIHTSRVRSMMGSYMGRQITAIAGVFGVRVLKVVTVIVAPEVGDKAIADRQKRLEQ